MYIKNIIIYLNNKIKKKIIKKILIKKMYKKIL